MARNDVVVLIVHGISVDRSGPWWLEFVPKRKISSLTAERVFVHPVAWEHLLDESLSGVPLSDTLNMAIDLLSLRSERVMGYITDVIDYHVKRRDMLEVVVLAHSMGTVLVHEALHRLSVRHRMAPGAVSLLVTVGSPLWILNPQRLPIRAILTKWFRKTVQWPKRKTRKPPIVRHWVDVRGLRDPVALYGLNLFPGPDRRCLAWCRHPITEYARTRAYKVVWQRIIDRQFDSPPPFGCCC